MKGANSGQFEVCNNETGKLLAADDLDGKPADGSWIPAAGVKPVAAHLSNQPPRLLRSRSVLT